MAGVVAGLIAVTRGFGDARDAGLSASAAAPGEDQPLSITRPGGYTVAYSGPIVVRSSAEQADLAESLRVTITPAGGGAPLPLRPYEGLNDLTEGDLQYVPLLTVRFEEAGDYLDQRTSGEGARFAESEVARRYAIDKGVPEERILIETVSRTTRGNLEQAALLMRERGLTRAILVSDPPHMARALRLARRVGIEPLGSATPTTRFRSVEARWRFLLREVYFFHRDLWDRLRGAWGR